MAASKRCWSFRRPASAHYPIGGRVRVAPSPILTTTIRLFAASEMVEEIGVFRESICCGGSSVLSIVLRASAGDFVSLVRALSSPFRAMLCVLSGLILPILIGNHAAATEFCSERTSDGRLCASVFRSYHWSTDRDWTKIIVHNICPWELMVSFQRNDGTSIETILFKANSTRIGSQSDYCETSVCHGYSNVAVSCGSKTTNDPGSAPASAKWGEVKPVRNAAPAPGEAAGKITPEPSCGDRLQDLPCRDRSKDGAATEAGSAQRQANAQNEALRQSLLKTCRFNDFQNQCRGECRFNLNRLAQLCRALRTADDRSVPTIATQVKVYVDGMAAWAAAKPAPQMASRPRETAPAAEDSAEDDQAASDAALAILNGAAAAIGAMGGGGGGGHCYNTASSLNGTQHQYDRCN